MIWGETDWSFDVSIRAPVRGRCQSHIVHVGGIVGFNPRPRAGAMAKPLDNQMTYPEFQSAPPCGGDGLP